MPTYRENPYSAFNFLVTLGGAQGDGAPGNVIGGFSEVSGLSLEVNYAEYRNGNEKTNIVRKIPTNMTLGEVTVRRGLVGSPDLFEWMKAVTDGQHDPRTVTITLLDEARQEVASWVLVRAQPKKWTGPTLTAAGGGEVAMEELSIVHEGIRYE